MDREGPAWPPFVTEWVLPYVQNRALWPVWFAVLGHVVVLIAGLLLMGWRGLPEGWVFSGMLLLGSAGLVVQEARISGLGDLTVSLGLMWLASAALAVLAELTGIF